MLDWSRATVLTLTEFEVSWELLGLGETPWQLDPPSPGHTEQARRMIVAGVLEAMQVRGLGDLRGPHPVLAEKLRLLATPESSLDVRFRGRSLTAGVTARRGSRGALAVRHRGEIAVLDLPGDAGATALTALFGPVTPGPGAPVTLPAAVLDAASAAEPHDPDRFVDELVRRGAADGDAHLLVRMCRSVDRRGQFGATAWTSDRRRRRAPYVVGIHRTPDGHYLQLRRRAPSGHQVVTVAPLGHDALLRQLDELAGAAAPA